MKFHNNVHPVHLFFFILFIVTALICVYFIIKKIRNKKTPKLLEKENYSTATLGKMIEIPTTDPSIFNIWPYVSQLKSAKILSHKIKERELVYKVYRDVNDEFEHILLATGNENHFVVLVVDRNKKKMLGYFILDSNDVYLLN